MCILFWARNTSKYKLIIASNRDEDFQRPTQAVSQYEKDGFLVTSAIDKNAGGTWLGVTNKRYAILTNYKEHIMSTDNESRGNLVIDYLTARENTHTHNGYNLLTGEFHGNVSYETNRSVNLIPKDRILEFRKDACRVRIDEDMIVMTNNTLFEADWGKQSRGKAIFKEIIAKSAASNFDMVEALIKMLKDCESGNDTAKERDDFVFVEKVSNYGTRTHTVILVDYNNHLSFIERDAVSSFETKIEFTCE